MTLPAFDLLAGVLAGLAALGRAAVGLGVNHRGGRCVIPAQAGAPLRAQPIVHGFEPALGHPAPERAIDILPGREIGRQHAPGAARTHPIATGVDQQTTRIGRRFAATRNFEDIGHQRPFGIGQ